MKIFRNTIITAVVLGVLIGVYYFVSNRPEEPAPPVSGGTITVYHESMDNIAEIKLVSENREFTFKRDGEDWKVEAPEGVELVQTKVNRAAGRFNRINARMQLEEPAEDLAEYGLDSPQAAINIRLKDGSSKTFYLGNRVVAGAGYYFKDKDSDEIYIAFANLYDDVFVTLSDLRDTVLFSVDPMEIEYVKMASDEDNIIELGTVDYEEDDIITTFGFGRWKVFKPYRRDGGYEAIAELLERFANINIKEFVSDNPDDLEEYGLGESASQLILKTGGGEELHLLIGDEADERHVYVKLKDSESVYTVEKNNVDFSQIKPFDLIDKFAFIVFIDKVEKITIDSPRGFHTVTLEKIPVETEGEEEKFDDLFKVDGKEMEDKPFRKFYQSLIGLIVDAVNDRETDGKPDVTTVFYLRDPETDLTHEVMLQYVPQDRYFYAVLKDGNVEFVISRHKVEEMLDTLDKLIKGELE